MSPARAATDPGNFPHAMRGPSKTLEAFRTPCAGHPRPWEPSARHARAIQDPGSLPHAMRGPSKTLEAFRTPCAGHPRPWKLSARHARAVSFRPACRHEETVTNRTLPSQRFDKSLIQQWRYHKFSKIHSARFCGVKNGTSIVL